MAWITENRRTATVERRAEPYLTDDMKRTLSDTYFPRYPTKRAVLLPALHMIQHAYNWIPAQAMQEVAAFLELPAADVMDTASFYEEYWLKPRGQYLVQVCRSLACEVCGSCDLTDRMKEKLGVEVGETSADGRFTLVELECLGACEHAPAALINETLFGTLTPEKLEETVTNLPENAHDFKDPAIDWEQHGH